MARHRPGPARSNHPKGSDIRLSIREQARHRFVPAERSHLLSTHRPPLVQFERAPAQLGPASAATRRRRCETQSSPTGARPTSQPGRSVPMERAVRERQERRSAGTAQRREGRTAYGAERDPFQPNEPKAADRPRRVIELTRLDRTCERHHQEKRRPHPPILPLPGHETT